MGSKACNWGWTDSDTAVLPHVTYVSVPSSYAGICMCHEIGSENHEWDGALQRCLWGTPGWQSSAVWQEWRTCLVSRACHISTQTLEELAVSKAAGERRLPASYPGGCLTVALCNKKCVWGCSDWTCCAGGITPWKDMSLLASALASDLEKKVEKTENGREMLALTVVKL